MEIKTSATTPIREKIKIFQLIENSVDEQFLNFLKKCGIAIIEAEKIIVNYRQNRRKNALKLFLSEAK